MIQSTVAKTPAPKPPPPADKRQQRKLIILVACVFATLVLLWSILALTRTNELPRLNDNAVVLTKFVMTKKFEQLPFEQQRQYYKVLDSREKELDESYQSNKLNESEYRSALEAAWLGKHLNRVEKYFALPPGQPRTTYLLKLVDKKEKKNAKPKGDLNKITADETAAELKVESWPPTIRQQWDTFQDAYREQKKAVEKLNAPTKPSKPSKKSAKSK